MTAEPDDEDDGDVADQHHRREHQCHQSSDPQCGIGQVVVRGGESLAFVGFPHESANHPNPGDLLAQDAVDRVDALLHGPETRHHPIDDHRHGHPEYGDRNHENPRELAPDPDAEDDAADTHDGRGDQDGAGHHAEHLDLLNIVGRPRDQRRRPECADLARGEGVDAVQQVVPDVAAGTE